MNGKPHSFNGTEGVVGLKRWFEKMEQVFEICKCAEDEKVKFAMCTFEGRALTWWNRNVSTLGLANANQIPGASKAMMTNEYCQPATESKGFEQVVWTFDFERREIYGHYNNSLPRTVLMCPGVGVTGKEKMEQVTISRISERIYGKVTSSKLANLA
ncbi:hypothetical protein Tco_0713217 [Tanacetum coccineum]